MIHNLEPPEVERPNSTMYGWTWIWFLYDPHRNSPNQVLGAENGEKILLACISWVCKAYPACTEGDQWRWWTVLGGAALLGVGNEGSWHDGGQWHLFLGAQIELEEQMLLSQALPWRHRTVLMASNLNHGNEHEKQNKQPFQSHQRNVNKCPNNNALLYVFTSSKGLGDNWPTQRLFSRKKHPAPYVIPHSEDWLWRTYGCNFFFFFLLG